MNLKEKITADLKTAMLARDAFATNVLRGLKASILNEEVSQNKRDEGLKDDEIEKILTREVKKRKEAASLLDEDRGGRSFCYECEGTIRIDGDDDGDYKTHVILRSLVEFLCERHDVDAVLTERGADGRSRSCLTGGNLQFD